MNININTYIYIKCLIILLIFLPKVNLKLRKITNLNIRINYLTNNIEMLIINYGSKKYAIIIHRIKNIFIIKII
jgi:hypothetical protein